MSHDKNGTPIKAGDLVVVECKVVSVTPDQDFCNLTLESLLAMPGNGVKMTIAAINAKQVLLTQKAQE
jgi:hypothetical protein